MMVEPSGRFLYVADTDSRDVSAYRIDARTGALMSVPGQPFLVSEGPCTLSVEPSSHFLYILYGDSPDVSGFRIDPTSGRLTPLPGFPIPFKDQPTAMTATGNPH